MEVALRQHEIELLIETLLARLQNDDPADDQHCGLIRDLILRLNAAKTQGDENAS